MLYSRATGLSELTGVYVTDVLLTSYPSGAAPLASRVPLQNLRGLSMNLLNSTLPAPILSGWKDIANHLGKGVRTVQRYEIHLGLPIRRPAGRARGSVVATRAELDAWINASPLRESCALRKAPTETVAALDAFKALLDEQHRLREEMKRVRAEMQDVMELLRKNLRVTQAHHIDRPLERAGLVTSLERNRRALAESCASRLAEIA